MSNEISRHYEGVFINGEWVKPEQGECVDVINPATEEVIGTFIDGGLAECDMAIETAYATFNNSDWAFLDAHERVKILERFIDCIEARAAQVIPLMVDETGTPVMAARGFMFYSTLEICRHYLDLAREDHAYLTPLEINPAMPAGSVISTGAVAHEPVGVVACITPFNAPLFLNLGKIIPAMVMGNTVILKPSPLTPLQALFLGDIAIEAGLPPGVLNILTGPIPVSEKLTTDPRVDLVSFTGSDIVGAAIMGQVAPSLKRVVLELGGKSANIVCADADVNAAALFAMGGTATLAGQGCAICTRHLVHNSIYPQFVERVRQLSWGFSCGDPRAGATMLGPLISDAQRQRVESYVQIGLDDGGKLLCGGRRPNYLKRGYYYEPTMFLGLGNDSRVAREEIFGPVGMIIGFDTEDEAIAIANDSDYGLSGNVFSKDTGRAYQLARRMRTGSVWINGGGGTATIKQPFGGIKRSGFGRENGIDGLMEYTFKKTITFRAA
jgi:aldehyde dehydrogenase (NAD+)